MESPIISVILPVYNAENTIVAAINSLLEQTYHNFEILVIDDGSIDRTAEIINSYEDRRIRYIKNEENKGLVYTLNRGLSLSTGKYIARMDADDIALNTRFEKQVLYMEAHPDVIVCGTFIKSFIQDVKTGKFVEKSVISYEIESSCLKEELIFECCFAHPSVIIRKSVIDKSLLRYDNHLLNGEDYKLWIDLQKYGEYHNIPEVLLYYRVSDTQMSHYSDITKESTNICRWLYLEKLVGIVSVNEIKKIGININTVKFIKGITSTNKYLLATFYLSFLTYSIRDILYFVFSLDIFRVSIRTTLGLLKRFFLGSNPIIY